MLLTFAKTAIVAAFVIGGVGRYVFLEWTLLVVVSCVGTAVGLLAGSFRLRMRAVTVAGGLRVDPGALSFGGRRVTRDEILSIRTVRRSEQAGERTYLELELIPRFRQLLPTSVAPGDAVIIDVEREEDAAAVIGELTGDGWLAQRRVRLEGNTTLPAVLTTALVVAAAIPASSVVGARLGETGWEAYVLGITVFPLLLLGFHELAVVLRRAPTLSILRDGLVVHRAARTEFVAWSDLVSIEAQPSELRMTCEGRTLRLRAHRFDEARVESIVASVRAQLAQQKHLRSAHFGVYGRSGSPARDWLRRIRELVTSPSYRANSASIDEAITVLTSPAARADERIGAAIALRLAGVDLSETHFRVSDVASEEVRMVLHRVGEAAEDEEIEAELRRMKE